MLSLRETRELIDVSQQRLADASGVNVHQIAELEQGKVQRPRHDLVVRVVRGLRRLGLPKLTADHIAEFHVPEDAPAEEPEVHAS